VNQSINNKTGAKLQLKLDGIHSKDKRYIGNNERKVIHYIFNLTPGESTIKVVQGIYDYTITGCGNQTKTGTIPLLATLPSWIWECKNGQLSQSRKGK